MLFNSAAFFIFFPLVTVLYFVVAYQYRWVLLLVASCIFYMWFIPQYLLILFILIVIDYWAGIFIEDSKVGGREKYLILSILATCFALFLFKYFNFFSASLSQIAWFFGFHYPAKVLEFILPIGLSFHTFQSLSYVIEVYKGRQKAERHPGIYALYVMFYPQLVAGPIERPQNLLHQFREKHLFEYARVVDGLKLMTWGLFKKVVIADRLAAFVNYVYSDPINYHGPTLTLATVFFAFQIYCDFSGYSDIAIGAAQVMGFRLKENFNRPYFSKSIAEFWKRWHISLSSWFRDYVYISLGGSRCVKWRWQANLFITFLISGLWHGANWTYVIWGGINGFYLIFGIWTTRLRENIRKAIGFERHNHALRVLQVIVVFSLVSFSWIFFRAKDLYEALYIVGQLPHGWRNFSAIYEELDQYAVFQGFEITIKGLLFSLGMIVFLICVQFMQRHGSIRQMLLNRPFWIRWSLYYLITLTMMVFGYYGKNQFIYFQF